MEHQARLTNAQFQVREIFGLIESDEKRRLARWQEEKQLQEQLVASLQQSFEILKKEKKRLKVELHEALAKATAAKTSSKKASAGGKVSSQEQVDKDADVVDLQAKLIDLNNRLLDIDFEVQKVTKELAVCTRMDEKELLSTKMVVMQDTKRILQSEIDALRSNIFRIETASKVEADKRSAEESGHAALARVEEQMNKITARIDLAKQQIYFPAAKGFRFSTGAGGVYMAAQDLFLSEISGRITVNSEKVTRADGTTAARLSVTVEGASNSKDWAEGSRRNGGGGQLSSSGTVPRARRSSLGNTSYPPPMPPPASAAAAVGAAAAVPLDTNVSHSSGGLPVVATLGSLASDGGSLASVGTSQGGFSLQGDVQQHLQEQGDGSPGGGLSHDDPLYDPLGVQVNAAGMVMTGPHTSQGGGSSVGDPFELQQGRGTPSAATAAAESSSSPLRPVGPPASLPRVSPYPSAGGSGHPPRPAPSTPSTAAGSPHYDDQHHPHGTPGKKGEIMSGFLSSLNKRKDKLKDMIAGQTHGSSSGGSGSGGGAWSGSEGGGGGSGGGGVMQGRLGQRMGKLREGLGERVDKMREGLGGRMDKVKEGLGEGMGRVKDSLSEMSQDSKGKLSKLAAAVSNKAPLGRSSAGGQSVASERGASGMSTPHNRSSAEFLLPEVNTKPNLQPHGTTSASATTSASHTPLAGHHHSHSVSPLASALQQPPHHIRRSSTETVITAAAGMRASDTGSQADGREATLAAVAEVAAEANLSVAFEEFESHQTRKGLYVQLLGERVQLVGERGTKVPDMAIREFMLEVEVALTAVIEWTELEGWRVPEARPLDLSITQLDHKMRGNSIPLPRTALKALLNMFLPGIVTRLLVGSLPPELGSYVVQSGEQLQLAGEFRVRGPALSTYMAPLVGPPPASKAGSTDPARRAVWVQQHQAATRARQLLGITEIQAEVINQLFIGPHALLDSPRPASICELCRMLVAYSTSTLWSTLCNQWNKALQVLFDMYGVAASDRISFIGFMEGPVSRVVRKPVQVAFMMDQLQINIDVDSALDTLHDFFARLCKELHQRSARGDDSVAVPAEPLEVQLEALQLWHGALSAQLRTFKSRFRTASCGLVVAADREVFQFGAENLSYDGPMRIRLPLEVLLDSDHSFVVDVTLPGRDDSTSQYVSGMTNMLQEIMTGLSAVADGKDGANLSGLGGSSGGSGKRGSVDGLNGAGGGSGRQAGAGATNGAGVGESTRSQDHAAYLKQWKDMVGRTAADLLARETQGDQQGGDQGEEEDEEGGGALQVPVLENPVVGQLSIRKAAVSLRLDEERMSELLQGATSPEMANSAGLLGTLLGCYGDLFSASLDLGWRPDHRPQAEEGATRPACMLTVANNEVTRVMASLESLLFSSTVSPRVAVSVLSAVVNGIMLRFYPKGSYQVRFWQRFFRHLHEYLGRDALDALVCLSARLETVKAQPSKRLRLVMQGDTRPLGHVAHHHPGGTSSSSSHHQQQQQPLPVYLLNEVNLLTLLDSVKLLAGAPQHDIGA